MYNFIKTLCTKLCKNYFEKSSNACFSHISIQDKLSLLLKPSTTFEVKITRKIQTFCQATKNNFWLLYYRLSQNRIHFRCDKNHKSNLCEEYILSRIVKYIQAFDREKESKVFEEVRAALTDKKSIELDIQSQEVVAHYIEKLTEQYDKKAFDFESGVTLIESAMLGQESSIKTLVEKRLQRYRVYQAPIVLKDLIYESLNSDEELKESTLIELLHREKFLNYIRRVIESRFIDFTRSSRYSKESIKDMEAPIKKPINKSNYYDDDIENMLLEIDKKTDYNSDNIEMGEAMDSESIENILKLLSTEQQIIYKLKYAMRLNNREFLSLTHRLNYLDSELLDKFTPDERLYIKFSIDYEIEDNSSHFSMIDVPTIKKSISKKISNYRGELQSYSYIEGKEEIFIKLIYREPLSAKEIGIVFNLTSKQIDKKVENIKKRLQKLEQKL